MKQSRSKGTTLLRWRTSVIEGIGLESRRDVDLTCNVEDMMRIGSNSGEEPRNGRGKRKRRARKGPQVVASNQVACHNRLMEELKTNGLPKSCLKKGSQGETLNSLTLAEANQPRQAL